MNELRAIKSLSSLVTTNLKKQGFQKDMLDVTQNDDIGWRHRMITKDDQKGQRTVELILTAYLFGVTR